MAALFAASRLCVGLTLAAVGAFATIAAEGRLAQATASSAATNEATRLAELARDLDRAQSVRAVKRLQAAYAQYAQAGLWSEMAQLFADNAEMIYGPDRVRGRDAIATYFLNKLGGGVHGMPAGALHAKMVVRPVVTLSQDGATAKGRWSEFSTAGRLSVNADWAGGIHENDYVNERGVWKIGRLHYHVQYAGSYEAGWLALEPDTKVVPYHFTAATVGTPAPRLESGAVVVRNDTPQQLSAKLAELDQRISRMIDEDAITNLQYIYGYYVDRKMWDDVADLFTDDGVFSITNLGVYEGARSIRRGLERDGPQGLRRGELNDHVLFDLIADVTPGSNEGRARGLDLTILGETASGTASLGVSVFESRFARVAGKWRIREMRVFPSAKTDYYQGWAKSAIVDPPPAAPVAPDRPARSVDPARGYPAVDFFFPHPVSGRAVNHAKGTTVVAALGATASRPPSAGMGSFTARLDEAERKLRVVSAYDGVENISSAFGDWLDDFKWESFSALFAEKGRRRKYQVGFYVGPERILKAETTMYGPTRSPRTGVAIHYRMQPVIDVATDGRSAKLRTRLFHISINTTRPGVIKSGMYPNDAAVLENGAWRFMNSSIDESYFESASYKDGWARPRSSAPVASAAAGGPRQPTMMERLVATFPPDTFLKDMPNRQQGFIPGAVIRWPDIVPMWFHYVNPISGRVPPFYCPDEFSCEQELARNKSR